LTCNFLSDKHLLICTAGDGSFVPSAFEIEEYCKTKLHKICPIYCKHSCKNGSCILAGSGPYSNAEGK
jgi:hypothetical protein